MYANSLQGKVTRGQTTQGLDPVCHLGGGGELQYLLTKPNRNRNKIVYRRKTLVTGHNKDVQKVTSHKEMVILKNASVRKRLAATETKTRNRLQCVSTQAL